MDLQRLEMPASCLQIDCGLRQAASTYQSSLDVYYGRMSRPYETGLSVITSLVEIPGLTPSLETV